jgi:hypothetical protein
MALLSEGLTHKSDAQELQLDVFAVHFGHDGADASNARPWGTRGKLVDTLSS